MTETRAAPFSSLTPAIALFCGALLFASLLMHRLLGMPTPAALNLFAMSFLGAAAALLLGIVALIHVWRHGTSGGAYALIGMAAAAGILGWPIAFIPAYVSMPKVNDVTTDVADPPAFVKLAKLREAGGNGIEFSRARLESAPANAYADLKPLLIPRPAEETYDIVLDAIKRMRFEIVGDTPPNSRQPGTIEAVDRTMIIGFYDDVVVRVSGSGGQSKIDLRSASRFGQHDFGRNASRLRKMLADLKARIDATVPGGGSARRLALSGGRYDKRLAIPKRLKDGKRTSVGRRTGQDRVQSSAQRAPVQKGRPQ
jgi:uncharacterized protein (DUF1499 family)